MSAEWPVVLFDLDGTLANTIPLILASYAHATSDVLGWVPPEETMRGWIGRTLWDTFAELAPDRVDQLVEAYSEWNLAHHDRLVTPYPGIGDLVVHLDAAGVRTGVVTSKREPAALATLASVGLAGRVPLLVSALDTRRHKPHPEPLLRALRLLGAHPGEAVYVGDAVVDLRAAAAAGTAGVGVTWGAGLPGELEGHGAAAVCRSTDELRGVLLGGGSPDGTRRGAPA